MSARFEVYYAHRTKTITDSENLAPEQLKNLLAAPLGQFVLLDRYNGSPDIYRNNCQDYSKIIGEAVYIAVQENVGCFHYEHWQDGQLLRLLSYNSDYNWHQVTGTQEAWEEQFLFSEEKLQETLDCYDQEFHAQIRHAWQEKHVKEGDSFPSINEIAVAGKLEDYLRQMACQE